MANKYDNMLVYFISAIIIIACIIIFVYLIIILVKPVKPIAEYEKTITVADKKVKERTYTTYDSRTIGDSQIMVPRKNIRIEYYIEGTDRIMYKTANDLFNRIKYNDTLTVSIAEYKKDPYLHITKIVSYAPTS